MVSAQAYNPTGRTLYQLGSEACLKERGNCAIYPKSAGLPSGRHAVAFAQARRAIPVLGTAHADTFNGTVPCTPASPPTSARAPTSTTPAK